MTRMTRETGADRLAADLRRRVLSGDLAPGTALREEAIAEEHRLSRHTVRRALERLVADRLLVSEPYRGVRVTAFSDDDVCALQQLRAALECEAVRLLRAEHGTAWPAEVVGPLSAAAARLSTATALDEAHAAFHLAVVAAAESPRITEAYARLGTEMLLFLRQLGLDDDPAALCAEHEAYLRDLQRTGEPAVRDHLARSTQMLLAARS